MVIEKRAGYAGWLYSYKRSKQPMLRTLGAHLIPRRRPSFFSKTILSNSLKILITSTPIPARYAPDFKQCHPANLAFNADRIAWCYSLHRIKNLSAGFLGRVYALCADAKIYVQTGGAVSVEAKLGCRIAHVPFVP